jgi:hypothetical protein
MYSGVQLQDPSPENQQLVEVIRELGGLLPGDPQIDWQELRGRCGEVLEDLARRSEKSRRLTELLEGSAYIVGGDEHHVIHIPSDADRVYKLTHGDNFGCRSYFSPVDPELIGHFHGETNADPFFYLNRWVLLNSISGFQTRFEGFIPPERPGWLPRICISQPNLPGTNPTPEEVRDALSHYGFYEVSIGAFFHPANRLLLTDAAPRNVRIVEGIPVPFDAIAQLANGRLLEWAEARISRTGQSS